MWWVAAGLCGGHRAIVLAPGEAVQIQLALASQEARLSGLTVEDDGRAWRRNLARFTRVFIGETSTASEVRILNPDVLRFEIEGETLRAWAEAPLDIENRSLGYRITYLLDRFESGPRDLRMRWDGRALFAEVPAPSDRQRRAWAEQRQRAFRGSFRHFLRTLAQATSYDEGYRLTRSDSLEAPRRYPVSVGALMRAGSAPDLFVLHFQGMLHVFYEREDTSHRYLEAMAGQSSASRSRSTGAPVASYAEGQASMLVLKEPLVVFHRSGLLIDPNAAEKYGYWAWEDRIANLLPYEYGMD